MRPRIALLAAAAVAAGTFAGCGDDDEPSGSPAATGAEAARDADVGMRNLRFDPETLTVRQGDEVVWVNRESIQHNVVARKGADFGSELLDQDETFRFTPDDEGTIEYLCTLHPGMEGRLVVEG